MYRRRVYPHHSLSLFLSLPRIILRLRLSCRHPDHCLHQDSRRPSLLRFLERQLDHVKVSLPLSTLRQPTSASLSQSEVYIAFKSTWLVSTRILQRLAISLSTEAASSDSITDVNLP
ncbi:hypothetical protein KP509_1Z184600 [Ceratopteris richardii]|nr:hypothetical protein KP509_1Z184600 [Ceratopteris richardii]